MKTVVKHSFDTSKDVFDGPNIGLFCCLEVLTNSVHSIGDVKCSNCEVLETPY